MSGLWLSLFICCLVLFSSCSDHREKKLLSDATFREIYSEIVYLGELHRGDTLQLRHSIDSLLHAYDTDTTTLYATARHIANNKEETETLYRDLIDRFEKVPKADSLRSPDEYPTTDTGE